MRPDVQPGRGTWVFAGPDYDLATTERRTLAATLVAANQQAVSPDTSKQVAENLATANSDAQIRMRTRR